MQDDIKKMRFTSESRLALEEFLKKFKELKKELS